MIFQKLGDVLHAISQPAHALLAGQLARAWGNVFADFQPRLEVLQAADLHDMGWTDWERHPTLNPETKLPYGFDELPLDQHLQLFTEGPRMALTIGRFQALLVSLHGSSLYNRGIYSSPSPSHQVRVDKFLSQQKKIQQELLDSLRKDDFYTPFCAQETINYNQQIIQFCDWMSLYICLGINSSQDFPQVPLKEKIFDFQISAIGGSPQELKMKPWPFKNEHVQLTCEARAIENNFDDEQQMRMALNNVPYTVIQTSLSRAE